MAKDTITVNREEFQKLLDYTELLVARVEELEKDLETAREVEEIDLDFSKLEELLKVEEVEEEDEEETKDYSTIDALSSNIR